MKVEKIVTKKEPREIEITGATLLSIEEYEKYKNNIQSRNYYWWLRSPGSSTSHASDVNYDGCVNLDGDNVYHDIAVVPALQICNLKSSDFKVGNKFEFGNHTFTIIGDNYALCDDNIGFHYFRNDWKADNANVYAASDVKRLVDDWFCVTI